METPIPNARDDATRRAVRHLLLQNATGGTAFMPSMWTNFKTMDVLAGVNAVMPGGFARSWPRFLNALWNRPPVDAPNGFKQWDRFPVGLLPTGGLDVVHVTPQAQPRTITFIQKDMAQHLFDSGVQPIAGHYRFESDVRGVLFHNTIAEEGIADGTVWAIEKIGGTWKQPIDLTKEWQKYWFGTTRRRTSRSWCWSLATPTSGTTGP